MAEHQLPKLTVRVRFPSSAPAPISGLLGIHCSDVPLTYYADLVRDVRERTTTACPQAHTFEVMRLALEA